MEGHFFPLERPTNLQTELEQALVSLSEALLAELQGPGRLVSAPLVPSLLSLGVQQGHGQGSVGETQTGSLVRQPQGGKGRSEAPRKGGSLRRERSGAQEVQGRETRERQGRRRLRLLHKCISSPEVGRVRTVSYWRNIGVW